MLTGVLMNTFMPYYHSGQRFLCSAFVFLHFLFYFSVSSPFPFYFSLLFLPLFFSHLCDHLPFQHYTYIQLSSLHSQHLSLVFLHPCISLSCLPESACQPFLVSFHCFQRATGSLWVFFMCLIFSTGVCTEPLFSLK